MSDHAELCGYVSVPVPEHAARTIMAWAADTFGANRDLKAAAKLHCTLMYDARNPVAAPAAPGAMYEAEMAGFVMVGPDLDVLALLLSDGLEERHAQLAASGMEHSWPPFTPHVTLLRSGAGAADQRAAASGIKALRQALGGVRLRLGPERWRPCPATTVEPPPAAPEP